MIDGSSAHSASCVMSVKMTASQWSKIVRHVAKIPSLGFQSSGQSGFTFSHSRVRLQVHFNGATARMHCAAPAHGSCFTLYGIFLKLISGALVPTTASPVRQRARARRP